MFALGCALNWLASDLEGADDVVVRLSAGGPDQIMVWDWSR